MAGELRRRMPGRRTIHGAERHRRASGGQRYHGNLPDAGGGKTRDIHHGSKDLPHPERRQVPSSGQYRRDGNGPAGTANGDGYIDGIRAGCDQVYILRILHEQGPI